MAGGLSLDLSTEDADGVNQIDGQGNSESDDASYEGVGLTIQRVFYPAPRARVSLYYGLGMRGFFSHQKVRVNHPTSDTTGSMWTGTNNHWSAGVAGILGVEWFATKSLSLTAEYGSTVRYHYYKNRTERFDTTPDGISKSTDESSNQGFDFGSDDVRLGLSVYF